eukprot:TRINITY_DN23523_c0_g1_i1.p1 TRINITY_DN23523_c0_g1~~TRINITY_DN23523_c0_g1_i1.p1  ORF type:complete len:291 (+),score=51.79 TRINITY_DN23523_c0_g1_i1:54-926(+)
MEMSRAALGLSLLCLALTGAWAEETENRVCEEEGGFSCDEGTGLSLLQRSGRQLRDTRQGCSLTDTYALSHTQGESSSEGGSNPWHTSFCSRTKRVMDDFEALVSIQRESCFWDVKPRKILSFGCSIGIECDEAKARYPDADIVGYDIDAQVIEKAKARTSGSSHATFTSQAGDLANGTFDLVFVNNVLHDYMSPEDFEKLFTQLLALLNPDRGVLQLMVYDEHVIPPCEADQKDCKGFKFKSAVAWDVIRKFLPATIEAFPHRTCESATYPSLGSTLFVHMKNQTLDSQ